jgi:hypothetical protein
MNPKSMQSLRQMAPAENVAPVTPDSGNDLPGGVCSGLLVTVAGNLEFVAKGGGGSGVYAVTAGQIVPVKIKRVKATTTATVLALYDV